MLAWQMPLVGAAALFVVFLLWQMRPRGMRRQGLGAGVRAARERARAAATPEERAEALCEAGALAVKDGARWTAAAGSFLRAMSAAPESPVVVEQLVQTFRRHRPRLLERILWRRLGHLPWDDAHRPVLLAIAGGLRGLYEKERRDAIKAAMFRRLEATFQAS